MSNQIVNTKQDLKSLTSHFWISSYPFFSSALLISPSDKTADLNSIHSLKVYDADGNQINRATLQGSDSRVLMIETDCLLSSCGLDAGLKHAQVEVNSPSGFAHFCRMQSASGVQISRPLSKINSLNNSFYPVRVSPEIITVIVLSNCSIDPVIANVSVVLEKKLQSEQISLLPRQSKLIAFEIEFADLLEQLDSAVRQVYLDVSSDQGGPLGVKLINRYRLSDSQETYSFLN